MWVNRTKRRDVFVSFPFCSHSSFLLLLLLSTVSYNIFSSIQNANSGMCFVCVCVFMLLILLFLLLFILLCYTCLMSFSFCCLWNEIIIAVIVFKDMWSYCVIFHTQSSLNIVENNKKYLSLLFFRWNFNLRL